MPELIGLIIIIFVVFLTLYLKRESEKPPTKTPKKRTVK